jgi:hypothetical protein
VEGARSTPRGVVTVTKPRQSARADAARRRQEAEDRNARNRRTRDLRATLDRVRTDAAAANQEVVDTTARLGDPSVYADASLVRDLVTRHNAARDRIDALDVEERRLVAELEEAETLEPAR